MLSLSNGFARVPRNLKQVTTLTLQMLFVRYICKRVQLFYIIAIRKKSCYTRVITAEELSMRYVLLLIALFLSACAPKYRTTYSYIAPESSQAQSCIQTCKEELATCQKVCEANFNICKKKAEKIGKQNYEKKLQQYYKDLEDYASRVQRYELDRELLFYDGFCYPGSYGFCGPFGGRLLWGPPPGYTYTLHKPVKPSLEQEILDAQMKECRIDCGCQQSFDTCYEKCGGKVIKKEICIKNCPK